MKRKHSLKSTDRNFTATVFNMKMAGVHYTGYGWLESNHCAVCRREGETAHGNMLCSSTISEILT